MFRQLTKGEVKEIADIMLREVFKRADTKGIKIDVTERFKVRQQLLMNVTGRHYLLVYLSRCIECCTMLSHAY